MMLIRFPDHNKHSLKTVVVLLLSVVVSCGNTWFLFFNAEQSTVDPEKEDTTK